MHFIVHITNLEINDILKNQGKIVFYFNNTGVVTSITF